MVASIFSIAECPCPFVFCNSEIKLLHCVLQSLYIEYYTGSLLKNLQEGGTFSRRISLDALII